MAIPGVVTVTPIVPASDATNPGIEAVTCVVPTSMPSKATPPVPTDPLVPDCPAAMDTSTVSLVSAWVTSTPTVESELVTVTVAPGPPERSHCSSWRDELSGKGKPT